MFFLTIHIAPSEPKYLNSSPFLFAVEYGIERMNREVSMWMKCSGEDSGDETDIPFIATRGYDSVVWSRMYSQDPAERTRRALMVRSR